jgi:hypothetical protein
MVSLAAEFGPLCSCPWIKPFPPRPLLLAAAPGEENPDAFPASVGLDEEVAPPAAALASNRRIWSSNSDRRLLS